MTGARKPENRGRNMWLLLIWAWVIGVLALYLQTFESTIRLLAGAVSGWIG